MAKSSVLLIYEAYPKPIPIGLSDDFALKVLVKHQLLTEAEEALKVAEAEGDPVVVEGCLRTLERLRNTLDMLIPPELEKLYSRDNGES